MLAWATGSGQCELWKVRQRSRCFALSSEACARHPSVASCWLFRLGDMTAGLTAPMALAKLPASEADMCLAL